MQQLNNKIKKLGHITSLILILFIIYAIFAYYYKIDSDITTIIFVISAFSMGILGNKRNQLVKRRKNEKTSH
ncbi:hypothetical protein WR164_14590 [Philodulcilactobacillus myokoensis]|uniref:Uncharacterized protein n=1 Tax=Philodulcilactobacillus myokoensis TaxID=2929573 RepID=A0A9W6ET65_9LACO|nr:hypothetical protein [Philodulcilactobacillus myokoensis]GLB47480.1 hypothetical protein WR164_14590 [Philodulcilactobacillus myokoensis]